MLCSALTILRRWLCSCAFAVRVLIRLSAHALHVDYIFCIKALVDALQLGAGWSKYWVQACCLEATRTGVLHGTIVHSLLHTMASASHHLMGMLPWAKAENYDYHKDRGLQRLVERAYPIKAPPTWSYVHASMWFLSVPHGSCADAYRNTCA